MKALLLLADHSEETAKLVSESLNKIENLDGRLEELSLNFKKLALEVKKLKYNYKKNPKAQTVFLPCDVGAREISSTAVRERINSGKDISDIVSKNAINYIYSLD